MGPWRGGQAEYLQVPHADFNCLPLPAGDEFESDFALLADIFPTGYHGSELADVSPGESVAVWGAGPSVSWPPIAASSGERLRSIP